MINFWICFYNFFVYFNSTITFLQIVIKLLNGYHIGLPILLNRGSCSPYGTGTDPGCTAVPRTGGGCGCTPRTSGWQLGLGEEWAGGLPGAGSRSHQRRTGSEQALPRASSTSSLRWPGVLRVRTPGRRFRCWSRRRSRSDHRAEYRTTLGDVGTSILAVGGSGVGAGQESGGNEHLFKKKEILKTVILKWNPFKDF